MSIELKFCPCCGNETAPRISSSMGFEDIPPEWDAWVVRCDASPDIGGCGMQAGGYETHEAAAAAWNRRADDKDAAIGRLARSRMVEYSADYAVIKQADIEAIDSAIKDEGEKG